MTGTGPQVSRIARLLGVPADEVTGLDHVPDDALRQLHDAISAAIFSRYEARFARIAGLSKALPGSVAGKLAERFLPPTLGARCAELLEPAKARDLVGKVSVQYLADLTLALNPARSEPVVRAIPAEHIGPVARALFDRKEYAAMAEFAGTVNRDALEAALDVATGEDLLRVVPLLVWNDTIDEVVDHLSDATIEDIVRDVTAGKQWDDVSRLVERLHPAKAADLVAKVPLDALAELAAHLDPQRLEPIVRTIPPARVGELARGLFARGDHAAMARFVGVVPAASIEAALDAASGHDLLRIVPLLEWNDTIDEVVDHLSDATIEDIVRDVTAGKQWDDVSRLVERLHPAKAADLVAKVPLDALAELAAHLDPQRFEPIVRTIPPARVGELARGLFARGDHAAMARFVGVAPAASIRAAFDVAAAEDLLRIVPLLEFNGAVDEVLATIPDERIDQLLDAVADQQAWTQVSELVQALPHEVRVRALDRAGALGEDTFARFVQAADDGRLGAAAGDLVRRAEQRRTAE